MRRRIQMVWLFKALFSAALMLSWAGAAEAQNSPAAQRGLFFVRTHCTQCHSTDRVSESPLRIAPPFRELHKRYPVETLEEAFGEGIRTGIRACRNFALIQGKS